MNSTLLGNEFHIFERKLAFNWNCIQMRGSLNVQLLSMFMFSIYLIKIAHLWLEDNHKNVLSNVFQETSNAHICSQTKLSYTKLKFKATDLDL